MHEQHERSAIAVDLVVQQPALRSRARQPEPARRDDAALDLARARGDRQRRRVRYSVSMRPRSGAHFDPGAS